MNNHTNSYSLLDKTDNQSAQLKILQTSSPQVTEGKREAGKILNSLTGESYDNADLVIFAVRKEFRVWGENLAKHPIYMSNDMKTLLRLDLESGDVLGEEPLVESEQWINRRHNKNARTQYYFIASMVKHSTPVFLRVGGLGFKRARRFLNQARNSGKQLYEFVTNLKVEQENTNFGKKYVPEFKITDVPVPEKWDQERVADICRKFIQETQQMLPAANT